MKKFQHILRTRVAAFLLALVCVFGLLPASAFAASADTIKLEKFGMSGVSYESNNLGKCTLHQMYYDYGGMTAVGFCGTKGAGMGSSLIGQTWGNPREITDPTVKTMMAYYYAHSTGVFTDEAKAVGVDTIWDAGYTWYMNAWVQAIIWRYQAGTLDDPVVACAEELMAVYNSLENTNYTSIDQERDNASFRARSQYILDLGSRVWGDCTVYEYSFTGAGSSTHPASSVQKVVIGELEVEDTEEYYSLIVKKVDATNPTKGLPGAEFHIESINGSYSKDVVTGPDGTYRLDGLPANTFAVTETSSPSGYEIDNAGPEYVVLPSSGSNTVTVIFMDTPVITGSGSIRKVDADNPSKGLAGAVIKIEGIDNNFSGSYVTVEGGALADVPWDTMPIGGFTATEVTPPKGYSLSPDPDKVKQEFYWDGKSDVALVFENDARVKIRLLKKDDSDRPLAGAVFNVIKDGQIIASEATDASGSIVVPNVSEGMFAFVEVFSPAPFARLTEPVIAYVDQATVDGGGTITVTAADQRLPNLTILKRDQKTKEVLPDTTFEVKGIHTGYHNDVTTGPDGKAVLTAIPVDSYEVTEVAVKEPYVISDNPTQTIWLGPGDDQQLVFDNLKQPLLTIAKTDADDPNVKIPGTVFLVEGIDSDYKDEWTTGDDGTATRYIAPGSYQITEKFVPAPYYISETESERIQTISLNAGDERTISFGNRKRPYIEILKENSITHDPIEHVKMQVWYASNNTATGEYNDLGVFYTDSEGRILLSEPEISLRDGWYRVRELEPAPGFSLPDEDTQEAFVPAGGSHTFRFQDRPLSAICVWKYDSKTGAALPDCWFQVKYLSGNTSGTGGTVIGTYRTSSSGSFTVTGCKAGAYIIEEVSSDGSHVIDTPPQTVYLSGEDQEVVEVYFGNAPKGSLLVKKVSTGTNKEPLSDVEFLVTTSDGTLVGDNNGKFVTDSSGSFLVENIDPGTVLVVSETRAKPGYLKDDVSQVATIRAGQTVGLEFRNQPLGSLRILKYSSSDRKTPLEGVLFKLTYADGSVVDTGNGKLSSNGLYYTDSNGEILINWVVGTIIATEVSSIPGYSIDEATRSQAVVVNPDDLQTLYFYNKPKKTLVLQKYIDDENANGVYEPLAGVEFLVTDSTGAYVGPDNGRYVSDSAGRVVITGLTAGMTITAREISTVSGYVLDGTPQTIEISDDDQVQTLYFYNKREGGLELIKVNEDDKSERIPNVTFEIRRAGDGGLVDTATTDRTGRFFVPLDEGSYYAVEIDCPENFRLDSTPIYFDVTDGKVTTKTVTNKAVSGIVIHKIDSVSGDGIYGTRFILYDNGKNPISEGVSDQDGYVYFDNLSSEATGRFYLRELEAAPGYTLDTQYKSVYLQPGKTVHIEWENTPITGQIQIYKYAAEANDITGTAPGTPLAGAVYEIVNARSGKVVDYITTDARGVAASKPLPLTRYQIHEVTAPAYWQVDPTVHDVTLEYAGQIIKISAYDKPSSLGVSITKRGNASVLAGSQMRYDITVANTSNVDLESFYWHDRIPTDAARATVLTTGTYSARLNYRILYKTNYNATYQVLASNLLTSNNYSFALNAIPMQAGEAVTDVYFDFGKVPVGFQSLTGPSLTVNVLGTTVNGYQLVNRADVGGKYQGTWQTAQASWVTIVQKYGTTPTLPKTGY